MAALDADDAAAGRVRDVQQVRRPEEQLVGAGEEMHAGED